MRLLAPILAALALALPAAAGSSARVGLVDVSPVVVRGAGFVARDHVAVRVSRGDTVLRKTVVATATGAFTARFRTGMAAGCGDITVVADGQRGRRAVAKTPRPSCGTEFPPPGP